MLTVKNKIGLSTIKLAKKKEVEKISPPHTPVLPCLADHNITLLRLLAWF